jgi:hypothetical protein
MSDIPSPAAPEIPPAEPAPGPEIQPVSPQPEVPSTEPPAAPETPLRD